MQLGTHLKCRACISAVVCGLLLLRSQVLSAETFDEQHAHLIRENPKGLSLTISIDKNTYYLGEIIPIMLTFSNNSDIEYYVETRAYDRSGRLWDIAFYVDGPLDGYCDPLDTYRPGFGGGLSSGSKRLGQYSQVFTLNEWVRFNIPGEYRIYCTSTRVWSKNDNGSQIANLCSQIIKIRIEPARRAFIEKTVSHALENSKSKDDKIRRHSIRTLRFLATNESVEAIVPFLGVEYQNLNFEAFAGIIGSRDWAHARKTLYDRMDDADIAVNSYYVRALAHVSLPRQEHLVTLDSENMEANRKRFSNLKAKKKNIEKRVLQRLASIYTKKRGRALAAACSLLLEREIEIPGLKQSLAKSFLHLAKWEQKTLLLDYRWEKIRCPEFEPVLRRILEAPSKREQWSSPEIRSLALLRYKEYEPEKARAMIINDIKQPYPLLAQKVLFSLSDETLPEIEDMLVRNLSPGSDVFKVAPLIERYATARVLPQVIEFYQKSEGRSACSIQASLLRYWVKHNRSNGLAAVVKAIGLREHTRCYTSVLWDVLSACYGPDAEEIAISFLNDEEPDVVVDVVRLLEHKGTIDCVDQLLAKLATLDPKKKEEKLPGASFSDVSVYREIVNCLMYNERWQLSDEQKQLLKQYIRTDKERNRYKNRFEPEQKVK